MTITNTIKLPSPADEIVSSLVDKILTIEPGFVEGVYLTGSIPLNDYYANKSDIDFLVLCKKLPDDREASQLRIIHKLIQKRYPRANLNGCYLPSEGITTDRPHNAKTLSYHEGELRNGTFEMAAIGLSELRFNAITIHGPKAETLRINITTSYLNQFLHENINSYWKKWIESHSLQLHGKFLLFLLPRLTEWSVLGVARQLCTLKTGRIVSKTEAGFYCLHHLPDKFHPVIRQAIEIRKDDRTYPFVNAYLVKPSYRRFNQTVDCVNFIIARFNESYSENQHILC